MPGPTEILTDDMKALRGDLHRVETSLREEIHRVDNNLTELRTEVKDAIGIGKWVATLVVSLLITGGAGGLIAGVWWASKITSKVEALEASIVKLIDQTRPAAK